MDLSLQEPWHAAIRRLHYRNNAVAGKKKTLLLKVPDGEPDGERRVTVFTGKTVNFKAVQTLQTNYILAYILINMDPCLHKKEIKKGTLRTGTSRGSAPREAGP